MKQHLPKIMMNCRLFLSFFILIPFFAQSQLPAFGFAFGIGNSANYSTGTSVTYDASGNIYVTGAFSGTSDFDPSASVQNLISLGQHDIYLAKYNSSGQYLWAFRVGSTGDDAGISVKVSSAGDIYLAGVLDAGGSADFDPNPAPSATLMLSSQGGPDVFIAKYNSSGQVMWAFELGSGGNENLGHIIVDALGNVYLTGRFTNTVDFDPSLFTVNVSSQGGMDGFLAKYNSSGQYVWAFGLGSGYVVDDGRGLSFDGLGNITMGGSFGNTVDFDPSASTFNMTSLGNSDGFVSTYSTTGTFVSAFQLGGPLNDEIYRIAHDGSGNLYVTGYFNSTADFDPSAATVNLVAVGGLDAFVAKYNTSSQYLTAFKIGSGGTEIGNDITTDAAGNVYVGGTFGGSADFNPAAAVNNLSPIGSTDMFLAKYNSAGNYVWAFGANASGNGSNNGIAVDGIGNVYSTGYFAVTSDFDPNPGPSGLLTSLSTIEDIYVAKYVQCIAPASPTNITSAINSKVCSGNSGTLSVSTTTGTINWYSSLSSTAVIGTGTNFVTPTLTTALSPTTASYYAEVNTCTMSPRTLVTITVNPLPIVSVSGKTLNCSGKPTVLTASGTLNYSWNTGALTNTISVSPTVATVYTVVGTNTFNCSSSKAFTLNTTILPTPSICLVTADDIGKYNEIYWDETLFPQADTFFVLREIAGQVYLKIGSVRTQSNSSYIDTNFSVGGFFNGNPELTSYRYKLAYRDTCGNMSQLSSWHQSIFVTDNKTGNFTWNAYALETIGALPSANYYLCRRDVMTGITTTVSGSSNFTINDPQYSSLAQTGNVKWFITTAGFPCSANLAAKGGKAAGTSPTRTKSNNTNERQFPVGIQMKLFDPASIILFPNPANRSVNIRLNSMAKDLEYKLMDVSGRIISAQKLDPKGQEIDLQELPGGLYFINIYQENTFISSKKLILEH